MQQNLKCQDNVELPQWATPVAGTRALWAPSWQKWLRGYGRTFIWLIHLYNKWVQFWIFKIARTDQRNRPNPLVETCWLAGWLADRLIHLICGRALANGGALAEGLSQMGSGGLVGNWVHERKHTLCDPVIIVFHGLMRPRHKRISLSPFGDVLEWWEERTNSQWVVREMVLERTTG